MTGGNWLVEFILPNFGANIGHTAPLASDYCSAEGFYGSPRT